MYRNLHSSLPLQSRSYCHDCNDGSGYIKNVCGSDTRNYDEACAIAFGKSADNCGDGGLTVYSHQCDASASDASPTKSWNIREDFTCSEQDLGVQYSDIVCGQEWFYPYYDDDDEYSTEHPFASSSHQYCLDCGLAIQVCASSPDATCENLGLTSKGIHSSGSITLYSSLLGLILVGLTMAMI